MGSTSPTFGSGGVATSSVTANLFPYSMGLQPDGKILMAGTVSTPSGITFGLARYTSSGSPDTSFGSGGETTTKIGNNAQPYAMAVQPDGKIVLAGKGNPGKTGEDFAVARYNTSGSLDTSFGSKGTLTTAFGSAADYADAVVIQPDGKIIAAGTSSQPDPPNGYPRYEFALARYNANGSLDSSFGSGGKVLTAFGDGAPYGSNIDAEINGMALQSDGKIVVAGYVTLAGPGGRQFTVARYNANGTPDTTFGPSHTGIVYLGGGANPSGAAFAVAIQADGKLVASGYANATPVVAHEWALARFNADGSPDGAFGSGGEVTLAVAGAPVSGVNDIAFALALQGDGRIVAAGTHDQGGSGSSFAVGRFNPDGSLDTTFGGTGIVTTVVGAGSDARGVAVQPADGKIVVAGGSSLGAAVARYVAADPPTGAFTAGAGAAPVGGTITLAVGSITDINPGGSITRVFAHADGNGAGKSGPGGGALPGYAMPTSPGVWTLTSTVNPAPGTDARLARARDSEDLFSDPFAPPYQVS